MKNWNNIGAVVLYSLDNRRGRWFASLEAAVSTLRRGYWDRIAPIDECNVRGYSYYSSFTWNTGRVSEYVHGDRYLIKDDLGLVLPHWKVREAFDNLPEPVSDYWRRRYGHHYKFRNGPVPRTGYGNKPGGRRNGRNGNPRLFQEYRYFKHLEDDEDIKFYNVKIRKRVTAKFRDFICYDSYHWQEEKNWKSFRKTQWK